MGLSRRTGSLGRERTLWPWPWPRVRQKPGLLPIPPALHSQSLNGQKKYQIHLKSVSGPIEVLLVNKEAWSSPPVAVPVPPPEDLLQSPPTVSTPSPLPKLAVALPQDASRPSSPHVTTSTCVLSSTEAQGVASPAAEITGKSQWTSGDGVISGIQEAVPFCCGMPTPRWKRPHGACPFPGPQRASPCYDKGMLFNREALTVNRH